MHRNQFNGQYNFEGVQKPKDTITKFSKVWLHVESFQWSGFIHLNCIWSVMKKENFYLFIEPQFVIRDSDNTF